MNSNGTARDLVTDWTEDFFTKPPIIVACAKLARKYALQFPYFTYIDSSAGKNEFASELCKGTKRIDYLAFDLYRYPNTLGEVQQQDWLTVTPDQLPPAQVPIAIGFNPPFGRKYDLLNAFVKHACEFQPDYLFLLCPAKYNLPKAENQWYDLKDQLEIPPYSFYRSFKGTHQSKWDGPHYACKFMVLQRRDSPKPLEKALPTKHPLVHMCKVARLADPDYFEHPEDVIIIRVTGNRAGHSYFLPQKDGTLDEYKIDEYIGNCPNWTMRGYSGHTYDCLTFQKPHEDTTWLRERLLQEWKQECPACFVHNTSNFSITRSKMCEMLTRILGE